MTRKTPQVPTVLHWRSRFFARTAPLWRRLARLESAVLREEIEHTPIEKPIYVAGVPRAGSTLLTETLADHPQVTSHRYSDFPNVYTPYWRNWLARWMPGRQTERVERAHGDRIMVTNESPEAVEEVLWMQFFEHLHDPESNQALDGRISNPAFESFYRDHVRKLLLVRNRRRYLAKGNYNTSRLRYIHKLFPDARFVVPVRNPVNQVASLVKQDRLFHRADEQDPRVSRQLGMSGHFEFGPGRLPVNLGNDHARRIAALWQEDRLVAGWALYWNTIYQDVLEQIREDPGLGSAVLVLRYEALCSAPRNTLESLFEHVQLDDEATTKVISDYSDSISEPSYYRPDFSEQEQSDLLELTRPAATALGYGS